MSRVVNVVQPEAGQIYYVDLGLGERKRGLIVTGDQLNLNPAWRKVTCVYLTSQHVAKGPWVALPSQGKRTVANCTEIFTLPKQVLGDRIEPDVSDGELTAVYEGIALALGAEDIFRELYG